MATTCLLILVLPVLAIVLSVLRIFVFAKSVHTIKMGRSAFHADKTAFCAILRVVRNAKAVIIINLVRIVASAA